VDDLLKMILNHFAEYCVKCDNKKCREKEEEMINKKWKQYVEMINKKWKQYVEKLSRRG
jgi:hypothetical protein